MHERPEGGTLEVTVSIDTRRGARLIRHIDELRNDPSSPWRTCEIVLDGVRSTMYVHATEQGWSGVVPMGGRTLFLDGDGFPVEDVELVQLDDASAYRPWVES